MNDPESEAVVVVSSESTAVPDGIDIRPSATPAEVVAILAAYAELWPKPSAAAAATVSNEWRFAGRWWRGIGPRAQLPVRR
jgi:hypothetical protein